MLCENSKPKCEVLQALCKNSKQELWGVRSRFCVFFGRHMGLVWGQWKSAPDCHGLENERRWIRLLLPAYSNGLLEQLTADYKGGIDVFAPTLSPL